LTAVHRLQLTADMVASESRARLAFVFDILRFRRRGDVTFRKWVILSLHLDDAWDEVRDGMAQTQPLRIRARG